MTDHPPAAQPAAVRRPPDRHDHNQEDPVTTPDAQPPAWPIRVTFADVYLRLPEGAFDVDITVSGVKVGRLTLTAAQYAELVGEHPEDHCARCGGPNLPWVAPSPLWNEVMRDGDINGTEIHDGIVCPTCFAVLAEERGIAKLWRLSATKVDVPLRTVTPSGRVWDEPTWMWIDAPPPTDPEAMREAASRLPTAANEAEAGR